MSVAIENLLSRKQVATRLNLTGERISQLARAGRLDFVWTPVGRLYLRESVERLRAERDAQRTETATASR